MDNSAHLRVECWFINVLTKVKQVTEEYNEVEQEIRAS